MRIDIFTLFPSMFDGYLQESILKRAQQAGLLTVHIHNIRDYTTDRHHITDEAPYGGGGGMVMKPEPIFAAVESVLQLPTPDSREPGDRKQEAGNRKQEPNPESQPPDHLTTQPPNHLTTQPPNHLTTQPPNHLTTQPPNHPTTQPPNHPTTQPPNHPTTQPPNHLTTQPPNHPNIPIILLSPTGRKFTQTIARELARRERIAFICGRYEGVDERVREHLATDELSIGDYVLTGGELPAMVVIDAVARHLPGVLGAENAAEDDSHATGLLEYPHYTRPPDFRGWAAPEVLQSGDHAKIARWRREQSLRRTWQLRPDLLLTAELTEADRRYLLTLAEESTAAAGQ